MSGIITILGLGAGELDQLSMGVYRKIKEAIGDTNLSLEMLKLYQERQISYDTIYM